MPIGDTTPCMTTTQYQQRCAFHREGRYRFAAPGSPRFARPG